MKRLRLAVLGCGHMGALHARKLAARSDVRLFVLDPAGVPADLPAVEDLPEGLDAAIVAVPGSRHEQVARPLVERGLPCLIEKPLAPSSGQARSLVAANVSVNHLERVNPALAALPQGLRPRYLRFERLAAPGPRGRDVDVLRDLMIHDLDLALHLAGPVRELRALGVPVLGDGVDVAEAWLEHEGGCVSTLTASRVSREPVRRLRIVDEGAYWSLDLGARSATEVRWSQGQLTPRALPVPLWDPLEEMHRRFLDAVRGQGAFPCPASQALQAVELAEALAEAVQARL